MIRPPVQGEDSNPRRKNDERIEYKEGTYSN